MAVKLSTKKITEEKEENSTTKDESKQDNPKSPEELDLEDITSLGPKSAKILREGGITTPIELMNATMSQIENIGLTRTAAKKLRVNVVNMFPVYYSGFIEEFNLEDIEGIGPTTAKNMREKGLNVHILENSPLKELEQRYGVTTASSEKYKHYITENIRGGWFSDAYTYFKLQQNTETFTLGADSLDQLLLIPEIGSHGIRAGETYEFYGAFRSGKSQICHQLCVTVQLPKDLGGIDKKAIYLDTEGTFSPTRITQMAERLKKEKAWEKPTIDILSDIMYARIKNSDSQREVAVKLLEILGEHPNDYGVLIVDSISAHFRAEYSGRGTLAERQQTLNNHLSILHRIADTYGLAVIITNQVLANPAQFFGDPTTPVGGNILGHWAGTRFYLRKSKGEKRVIRIVDSAVFAELEAVFEITQNGIISSD